MARGENEVGILQYGITGPVKSKRHSPYRAAKGDLPERQESFWLEVEGWGAVWKFRISAEQFSGIPEDGEMVRVVGRVTKNVTNYGGETEERQQFEVDAVRLLKAGAAA